MAVIENHVTDGFENTASVARYNYYGYVGLPIAVFDGGDFYSGGSETGSIYEIYLPYYNDAIAIPSSFTMDMTWSQSGANYTITIEIEKVAAYTGTNLVCQLALTESHIPYSWGIADEFNYVNRGMYPDYNGTPLDFSGGNLQTVTLNFTADESWVIENCELVCFIQNNNNKQILQSDKVSLSAPVPALVPVNGAVNVMVNALITISFNQPVRNIDDSPITDPTALIIFKQDNASGSEVDFTASINQEQTVITITPAANLLYLQNYYVAIGAVLENFNNIPNEPAESIFTTELMSLVNTVDENLFYLYPNPAQNYLNINFTARLMDSSCEIIIYDMLGKIVLRQQPDCQHTGIDITSLTNGHYIARMENGIRNIIKKFEIVR